MVDHYCLSLDSSNHHAEDPSRPQNAIPYHVIIIASRPSDFHSLLNALRHVEFRVRSCASTTTVTHNVQQRESKSHGKSQPKVYHKGQSRNLIQAIAGMLRTIQKRQKPQQLWLHCRRRQSRPGGSRRLQEQRNQRTRRSLLSPRHHLSRQRG
jgi:hypothetical protein